VELTIPGRYCGPPESGNGGWVSGALAALVPTTTAAPAVTVRLASPPPLDRALRVEVDRVGMPEGPVARLLDGDHLVATATAVPEPAPPDLVPATVAEARELLAPVHAWFTEGFDLPDLKEARALLDALG